MTRTARYGLRLIAGAVLLAGALTVAAPLAGAQDTLPAEPSLDQRRDAVMQACLDAGTAADECDCGLAHLRANLDEEDEALVLEILANLSDTEPAAFAEARGISESQLNAEILRLQPTLADLASSCG